MKSAGLRRGCTCLHTKITGSIFVKNMGYRETAPPLLITGRSRHKKRIRKIEKLSNKIYITL